MQTKGRFGDGVCRGERVKPAQLGRLCTFRARPSKVCPSGTAPGAEATGKRGRVRAAWRVWVGVCHGGGAEARAKALLPCPPPPWPSPGAPLGRGPAGCATGEVAGYKNVASLVCAWGGPGASRACYPPPPRGSPACFKPPWPSLVPASVRCGSGNHQCGALLGVRLVGCATGSGSARGESPAAGPPLALA